MATPQSPSKSSPEQSVWERLSKIDVSSFTERKNGMTYLSWAHAWGVLKSAYPDASFEKVLFHNDCPYVIDANGYAYVVVRVRAGDQDVTEVFPVLDYKNKSIQNPNSFDVNTALQRGLTKAMAYLGLGHYIYAGEDLPVDHKQANPETAEVAVVGKDNDIKMISDAKLIATAFIELIKITSSEDELKQMYRANTASLETLEKKDADLHAKVIGAFTKRKAELASSKDETES